MERGLAYTAVMRAIHWNISVRPKCVFWKAKVVCAAMLRNSSPNTWKSASSPLLTGSAATWETSNANALSATMATCLVALYLTAWCESLLARSLQHVLARHAAVDGGSEEGRRRWTARCRREEGKRSEEDELQSVSREALSLCLFSVSLKKKPSDAIAPFTLTGHWATGTDTWIYFFPRKRTTFGVNASCLWEKDICYYPIYDILGI